MEDLRGAALAYYMNLSEDEKQRGKDFFNSMDADNDGTVSLQEYTEFLGRMPGFGAITRPEIFRELDKDGNGSLDFLEVITLFYICHTKKLVFCDGCGAFLKGIYFTCVQCFNNPRRNSYDLCSNCYKEGKKSSHGNDAVFCDNFALLRLSKSTIETAPPRSPNTAYTDVRSTTTGASAARNIATATHIASSATHIASTATDIASTAANIASIAGSCVIM